MRVLGHILVIDDDPFLCDALKFLLELEGYRVRAVPAPVALAMTLRERPDLVLLDLDMPIVDGLVVRSYLLADPATAVIPVVAMAEAEQLARCRATLQVQGMVAKPLHYHALLGEIARHLLVA